MDCLNMMCVCGSLIYNDGGRWMGCALGKKKCVDMDLFFNRLVQWFSTVKRNFYDVIMFLMYALLN